MLLPMNQLTAILLIISILMFSSCNSDETTESSSNDSKNDSISNVDSSLITTGNLTMAMMLDGPDDDIYIPNDEGFTIEQIKNAKEIDLVPYVYEDESDPNAIHEMMAVIGCAEFEFHYEPLDEFTGKVNLYYDLGKSHLASSFDVISGKPNGNCTLYDPDGYVYIERVYNADGWQFSGKEPYSVDWTYDPETSELWINDVKNGIKTKEDVEIMRSFRDENWEYFDQIIDKASFVREFKVNGSPFTGKLTAYQHPVYFNETHRFELNFKDGYLHGDIFIFEWWGELVLHEKFENGEFVEEIYKMDESMMDGVAKPIIYLYPEKETKITVKLNFDGHLSHTYPKYNHGWSMTASSDGTLVDSEGKEYYALYWEGHEHNPLSIPNGTILKGEETITFLEKELPMMGLNAKETNEFIIYWMPQLENNKYNLIHFSANEYTKMAQLAITPKPETLIRVMMVFQPLDSPIEIKHQNLSELYKVRKGFTVVEWGGRRVEEKL